MNLKTAQALGLAVPPSLLVCDEMIEHGRRRFANLRRALFGAVWLVTLAFSTPSRSEMLVDENVRASMLAQADGRIAHVETSNNDIFITKIGSNLMMSFRLRGAEFTQSYVNLIDADDLQMAYTQVMTAAVAYAETPKQILMIGLGGGAIPTYLARFMPDATIATVEIDPGVIEAAKRYFGILETSRVRYLAADGRVFLNRSSARHDVILVDAYHGDSVPFHLLTKEFYTLVKQRLTPNGAAAFNVRLGTKLYAATLMTLKEVFPTIEIYPVNDYQVIVIASNSFRPDDETLSRNATALQERYRFRYALPQLVAKRLDPMLAVPRSGVVLTDDFAPVEFLDSSPEQRK